MYKSKLLSIVLVVTSLLIIPRMAYAQDVSCTQYVFGDEPLISEYITCVLPHIFTAVQYIFIAIILITSILLIKDTATNMDNPDKLTSNSQ